ncbi:MAG: UvrD-helicase domain-containing protein, partial [Rhizobacter sp.]
WMLVSRILRALLDGAEPQEILAITFTRKAAGEMRSRLGEWLTTLSAGVGTEAQRVEALQQRGLDAATAQALAPTLAGLQQRLQRAGRSVEIRTFHAWFSQLLKAAPLDLLIELGVQRDAQIVEDIADHENEVYRRFHGAVVADDTLRADYHQLVQRRGRSQVRKWLDAAWAKRVEIELADAAGTLEPSVAAPMSPWPQAEDAASPAEWVGLLPVRQTLQTCASMLGRAGKAKATEAARALEAALSMGVLPGADHKAVFEALWLALFTLAGTPRKGLGDGTEQQAAIDLLIGLREAVTQQEARDEHLRMVRLSRVLFTELAAYKRARGLVEMADLERCAVALLGDSTLSGWVQERLDARVRHLLIDEFQDTSPLQWHALVGWLSGYAGAGGGASGQRAPSVFIVGDPKQSIYRFRRAEPKVFEAARDFVQQGLDGQVLSCDHTRRNAPEVLAVLNCVFSQAGRDGEFAGFRPHSTSIESVPGAGVCSLPLVLREPRDRGEAADAHSWRDTLAVPRVEPEQRLRQQEADRLASAVREVLAGGVSPGQVQVLCRKRESLRLAAASLQALGVPCAAVEEGALFDAPEVRDLVAVLDVLASPGHALSLAQALKSPIFGCTDDDLVQLATSVAARRDDDDAPGQRPDSLAWWAALCGVAEPSAALERARALFGAWQQAARTLPPHDLLDRIVDEGEVIERTLAAVPRMRRAAARASIDALLAQSLMLDGARGTTPYSFVRALRRRHLKIAVPAQPEAVQLLTVHGAKGLEAEVVFVMDTQPEPNAADTATLLVQWPVESPHPLHCAFVYAESRCPPLLQNLFDEELAARRREELNGLYVSMTRAKHRLVISATVPHRAPSTASWWQRLEPHAVAWTPKSFDHAPGDEPMAELRMRVLPRWQPTASAAAASEEGAAGRKELGSLASRLGQAVHRVLEWAVRTERPGAGALDVLCAAAAREFGAEPPAVQQVVVDILGSPDCQRFFDPAGCFWAGNEVGVTEGGEVLRIDRLVHLRDAGEVASAETSADGVWWVLDYKLSHAPQELDDHREQLRRYRRAVSRLQPGATVKAAFITGHGTVIELT